jgi:hypothetical protein
MYYYGVWLKHLSFLPPANVVVPANVLEFGPGNTFAMGVAAALSGTNSYVAVEKKNVVRSSVDRHFIEELTQLYRQRAIPRNLPGWPNYEYEFSRSRLIKTIFSHQSQELTLSPTRIDLITESVSSNQNLQQPNCPNLVHLRPSQTSSITVGSFDLIISHSVLEHVKDIKRIYPLASEWLRDGGYFSAHIDLSSHGATPEKNGHWRYGNIHWTMKNLFNSGSINRIPRSKHLELLLSSPFTLTVEKSKYLSNKLPQKRIAKKYQSYVDADINCTSLFIQACRRLRVRNEGT